MGIDTGIRSKGASRELASAGASATARVWAMTWTTIGRDCTKPVATPRRALAISRSNQAGRACSRPIHASASARLRITVPRAA